MASRGLGVSDFTDILDTLEDEKAVGIVGKDTVVCVESPEGEVTGG